MQLLAEQVMPAVNTAIGHAAGGTDHVVPAPAGIQ
jgi:hypothetical protein